MKADMNDPHEAEALEYEFHRLMSIAEAFTGAEKLRQKLPPNLSERVLMLQKFIDEEEALREPHRVPYTIEAMKKKINQSPDAVWLRGIPKEDQNEGQV